MKKLSRKAAPEMMIVFRYATMNSGSKVQQNQYYKGLFFFACHIRWCRSVERYKEIPR